MAHQQQADTLNSAPNGQPNPQSGAGTGALSVPQRFARPFTLFEALPFSPFTSVIPFHPGVIPSPSLGSGLLASDIAESVPRQDYDALNREAAQLSVPSRRLEQTLEQVQQLLSPNRVAELTFRAGPKASRNVNTRPAESLAADLSPIAKMIFESTDVAYRYPAPGSANPPESNGKPTPSSPRVVKKSPVVRKSEPPKLKSHVAANKAAHAQNAARIEINIPTQAPLKVTISPITTQQVKTLSSPTGALPVTSPMAPSAPPIPAVSSNPPVSPAVSIPPGSSKHTPQPVTEERSAPLRATTSKSPSEGRLVPQPGVIRIDLPTIKERVDRDQYINFMDAPDVMDTSGFNESQDVYGLDLDQRQKSDAALNDLQRHFTDIFIAESNLGTHPSARQLVTTTGDGDPTISTSAQQRSYVLIEKAIELRCFADVPLEDLLRIQKLSEGALKYAEGLDVKLDEGWEESEVMPWAAQLPDVDTGLRAARSSLKVMSGGREDRQLYSENTIQLAVNLLKSVMDGIIVPITELRHSGPTERLFRLLMGQKKSIATMFTSCQRLYSLMASLISVIELPETLVSALEYLSTRLIFVENATSERDSLLGTQKFDGLRLVAMDMLSQIFLMNPSRRQGIFDDILTSLEKLPVGKQSARQFKLVDGKAIQPVSALIMRLVQASAGRVDDPKARARSKVMASLEDEDGEDGEEARAASQAGVTGGSSMLRSEAQAGVQHTTAVQELKELEASLDETAQRNASYVTKFIVNRAVKSTKSGDTPYRNLLDLFVEDFTTCLDSPDWPAAEILLRVLMFMMLALAEGERTAAPAKNMALELLGSMGAAISKLRSHVRKTGMLLDTTESDEFSSLLSELATAALEKKSRPEQMLGWNGPFRAVLEHLEGRLREDPHLGSAISFLVVHWANKVTTAYDAFEDDDEERDHEFGRLAYRLRMMIQDRRWLSNEYRFRQVLPTQAKAAYAISLVQSQLCDRFPHILNILMTSMASDQATVRSKSLKSINQVIDTDPSILDGDSAVVQLILQCSSDSSTQVRDSALGLIGKCITLRPALELRMVRTVTDRFSDTGVGVRKRAMKLAKDIYLRNHDRMVRSHIASCLLHRIQDPDDGVRELARQMVEETWIFPFYNLESSAEDKTSLADHVALMVQTVKQGNVAGVLDKVLQTVLAPEWKTARQNFEACRKLVSSMFDMVDTPDSPDSAAPAGKDALQVLMIFAKADGKLFTFEQIRLLRPQIISLPSNTTSEEIAVSRAAVVIYLRVLPQLSSQHHEQFLSDIRQKLLPAVTTAGRQLLDDIIGCVWIISGILGNAKPLCSLVVSSLIGIQKIRAAAQSESWDEKRIRTFVRYALIVGMIGKHCDLDPFLDQFKEKFPRWQGTSASKLIVDVIVPMARPGMPMDVRKNALDAVGLVCQSSPRNYVSPNVYTTFQEVFDSQEPALESMVMRSLKEFLITEEKRSEQASAAAATNGEHQGGISKKELTVMGGTNYDDVASATTQRFLKDLTRIAMATMDEHAFLAVELLASINRQGLVHPKETGVTMMTLETCPVRRISELAFQEHRLLHEKHESVLEREYAKALQSIFQYQRDNVGDPRGATADPFTSKLHLMMEALKISKSKNRQRFLQKLCSMIDFDVGKLDVSQRPLPTHVEFSRFVVENLAFFDYMTIGELQMTITALEKLVTSTGASVAQAIESDIFQVRIDGPGSNARANANANANHSGALADGHPDGASGSGGPAQPFFAPPVDQARLRLLTASSMILSVVWEARTYLRKLYNLKAERRGEGAKGKAPAKDLSKAPIKVATVTGDRFWEDVESVMSSLSSDEAMMSQCRAFVELLNVDKEFRIADEDAAEDALNNGGGDGDLPATPSGDEDEGAVADSGRGRKRKASSTPGQGRKKQRARSGSQPRKRGRPRKNPLPVEDDADMDADGDWV